MLSFEISNLSLYHKIVGIGLPVALQVRLTVEWRFPEVDVGGWMISGGIDTITTILRYK